MVGLPECGGERLKAAWPATPTRKSVAGAWTRPLVPQVVEDEFSMSYYPAHVSRISSTVLRYRL